MCYLTNSRHLSPHGGVDVNWPSFSYRSCCSRQICSSCLSSDTFRFQCWVDSSVTNTKLSESVEGYNQLLLAEKWEAVSSSSRINLRPASTTWKWDERHMNDDKIYIWCIDIEEQQVSPAQMSGGLAGMEKVASAPGEILRKGATWRWRHGSICLLSTAYVAAFCRFLFILCWSNNKIQNQKLSLSQRAERL